jgi:phage baseplate assembly protein W
MIGTNATSRKPLAGIEHLRQSIRDILTTPIGSRIMRRDFGSGCSDWQSLSAQNDRCCGTHEGPLWKMRPSL